MNHRYAIALILFALTACATPGPGSTEPGENADALEIGDIPIAAEAVVVKSTVPKSAKESGLVDDDTLVCKKEKIVGSHIPRMVCLTAKEHAMIQKTSQGYHSGAKRAPEPKNSEG